MHEPGRATGGGLWRLVDGGLAPHRQLLGQHLRPHRVVAITAAGVEVACRGESGGNIGSVSAPRGRWIVTDWRERAACRDEDPELFFPIGATGPALDQAERAKAVCRRCPVIDQCLAWALTTGQDAGIWGGLTEQERRELRHASRDSLSRARNFSRARK